MNRSLRAAIAATAALAIAPLASAVTPALAGGPHPTGATANANANTTATATSHQRNEHVFVIMLENHSKHSVIGQKGTNPANGKTQLTAPYITSLAHTYAWAQQYYGVTHPSMPNYIATIAGSNFGINIDDPDNNQNLPGPTIVQRLEGKGLTWRAYMEDLPKDKMADNGPVYKGTVEPLYARKHNPFTLFPSIYNSPQRMRDVVDYSQLALDLNSQRVGQFNFIVPNQCNDMHGGVYDAIPGHPETPCPYGNAITVDAADFQLQRNADAFVKKTVTTIMQSRAWTPGSIIVVTSDENDFDANNPTVGDWENAAGCCDSPYIPAGDPRVSPDWPGGVYGGGLVPTVVINYRGFRHVKSDVSYNHYSLLASIEKKFGLTPMRNDADRYDVPTMDDVFNMH